MKQHTMNLLGILGAFVVSLLIFPMTAHGSTPR